MDVKIFLMIQLKRSPAKSAESVIFFLASYNKIQEERHKLKKKTHKSQGITGCEDLQPPEMGNDVKMKPCLPSRDQTQDTIRKV